MLAIFSQMLTSILVGPWAVHIHERLQKNIGKTPKGQIRGIKNNPWYADNFVMTNRRKQLTILSLWTMGASPT